MKATLLSGVLSVWLGSVLLAEGPGGPPPPPPLPGPPGEMLDRAFDQLDANGDGQIDKAEFRQGLPEMIRRFRERREQAGFDGPPPPPPGPGRRGGPPHAEGKADGSPDRRDARREGPPPAFGARPPLAGPRARHPEGADRPAGPPDDSPRRAEGPRPEGGFMIFGLFDANRDHKLDQSEIENASTALAKLDADGDGEITPAELRQAGEARHAKRSAQGPGGEKGAHQRKGPRKDAKPGSGPGKRPADKPEE